MLVIALITYPMLQSYKAGGAISENVSTKYGEYSISNLGYSSVQCSVNNVGMESMTLTCPYGTITKFVESGVGINGANSELKDACLVTDGENSECTANLDMTQVTQTFDDYCVGQESCYFNFKDSAINYWSATPGENCTHQSFMFMQYECAPSEAQLSSKYQTIALATATIMLVAFLFTLVVYYL